MTKELHPPGSNPSLETFIGDSVIPESPDSLLKLRPMFALLLTILYLMPVQQTPPTSPPNGTQKGSTQPRANTDNQVQGNTQQSSSSSRPKCEETSKQGQSDDAYDKWLNHAYEWATIAGVVGGWVVLCIVWRQSQAVVNAERAWIMVDVRPPADQTGKLRLIMESNRLRGDTDSITPITKVNPLLVAKNQGRTPAWIFEWKVCCQITNIDNLPPEPDFSPTVMCHTDTGVRPVAVNVDSFRAIPFELDGESRTPQFILVYGVVRYRDIFGKKHKTLFGWGIWGDDTLIPINNPAYHQTT